MNLLIFKNKNKTWRKKENEHKTERNKLRWKELENHKFESMKWSCRDGVSTFFASYRIGSAALGDLSIHLLWPCSNAPNNTPFLFYSARLSLCWVAQQNYVPNNNYQSKLWSKKLRLGKLLTRISSRNSTSKLSAEGGEREDFALLKATMTVSKRAETETDDVTLKFHFKRLWRNYILH